ncbi:MAG: hypothetical protein AAFV43_06680 [Planctomycetota bacterium]
MDQLQLLRTVVEALERLSIRYAVVGSFASGVWGEPRFTNDIDIVVEMDVFAAVAFCRRFASDEFYVSASAAEEAVERGGQFNLIHPPSGGKVDLMIASESAWSADQLRRAVPADLLPDRTVRVARPEDVILGKLLYYRDGGSDKHVRDITGVLATDVVKVDREYLDRTADELGVGEEWRSILAKLG